jgi:predicted ATPase
VAEELTRVWPDLLPALARLIIRASQRSQVWVVSHASRLIAALNEHPECHAISLEKSLGQTQVMGQGLLDEPVWHWPYIRRDQVRRYDIDRGDNPVCRRE